jgi:hypothetical protein
VKILFAVVIIANKPFFGLHTLPDNSFEIGFVSNLADPGQVIPPFVKLMTEPLQFLHRVPGYNWKLGVGRLNNFFTAHRLKFIWQIFVNELIRQKSVGFGLEMKKKAQLLNKIYFFFYDIRRKMKRTLIDAPRFELFLIP